MRRGEGNGLVLGWVGADRCIDGLAKRCLQLAGQGEKHRGGCEELWGRRRSSTHHLCAKPRCGSPLQISGGTQHKGSFGSYLHRSHRRNFALLLPLKVKLAKLCIEVLGFFFLSFN